MIVAKGGWFTDLDYGRSVRNLSRESFLDQRRLIRLAIELPDFFHDVSLLFFSYFRVDG
jgi:hypothetical protein